MWNLIQAHLNTIIVIVVAIVAIIAFVQLRKHIHRLKDFAFGAVIVAGVYLWVSTFFPNDVPQYLGNDGIKILVATGVIVYMFYREGATWLTQTARLLIITGAFASLFQIVVVGFAFDGNAPVIGELLVQLPSGTNNVTLFGIGTLALALGGGAYLFNRRVRINREERDNRDVRDYRNLDIKDHNITQNMPLVPVVQITTEKAPIYLTPSQNTTKFVPRGKTFRAIGRTMQDRKILLVKENGRPFWVEKGHIEFLSGDIANLPPL